MGGIHLPVNNLHPLSQSALPLSLAGVDAMYAIVLRTPENFSTHNCLTPKVSGFIAQLLRTTHWL